MPPLLQATVQLGVPAVQGKPDQAAQPPAAQAAQEQQQVIFVTPILEEAGNVGNTSSGAGGCGASAPQQQPQQAQQASVVLGELLGAGAFGRVFRGCWGGRPVAVKMLQTACPRSSRELDSFRCAWPAAHKSFRRPLAATRVPGPVLHCALQPCSRRLALPLACTSA